MMLLALVPSSLPIVCLWISVLRNAFLFGIEVRILQNWCTKWVKAQDLVLILVLFPLHFSSSCTGFVRLDRDQIQNCHEMEFYLVELKSLSLFRKYQIPEKQVLRGSIAYMQNDCSLIWKSCSWANCFNCQNTIRFCTFLEFCFSVRSCYDISRDCCCVDWLSLWRLQDDEFFLVAVESQVHWHRTISKVGKFCIIHMPVTSHESWAVDSRCFFIGSQCKSFMKVQTCAY